MKRILLLFVLLPLAVSAQVNLISSNLPIVVLNTNGQSIPVDSKLTAQMQVLYKGPGIRNYLNDTPSDYNGLIGIERRGSTSDFFSEKKPYSVETRDLQGDDLDFPLLGMPSEADWAFIAPYNDKTLIRDALMYELARRIMPWAPRTRFVELMLNGEYQGVYTVTEKIKRGKDRVDISKLKSTDLAGDSLTGGFILKIDKTTGTVGANWTSPFPPFPGAWQTTLWQVHYPKADDIQAEQRQYINNWINNFEATMNAPDFADTATGYPKLIDVQSFIDFTLLNELAKNVDSYRLSTFFWKDRDDKDPRLHAGPIWDFNIGLGNADYCEGQSPSGWAIDFNSICGSDNWVNQFWWQKMWQDQQYRRQMKERWAELRAGPLNNNVVLHVLDSLTNLLQESQARNFQRWPVLNTYLWPNPFCCGTYVDHTNYLRNWIQSRLQWMDNTTKTLYVGEYKEAKRFVTKVFPNPSFGELHFKMYLHYHDYVHIRIYNALGQFMTDLAYSPELHGESEMVWTNDLREGIYFYEVRVNGRLESNGKILVK